MTKLGPKQRSMHTKNNAVRPEPSRCQNRRGNQSWYSDDEILALAVLQATAVSTSLAGLQCMDGYLRDVL